MQRERRRTTLYVTHDQEEALVMSDRIAVMRAGRIVQIGSGRDLYDRPVDAFVARFLGESNLLEGKVTGIAGGWATLAVPGLEAPVEGRAADGIATGETAFALIRPEMVRPKAGGLRADVVEQVYLGELTACRFRLAGGQELWCRRLAGDLPESLDGTEIGWDRDRVSILPDAER